MRVTFEFHDDYTPCAIWLNYVVADQMGRQSIGVRCAGTEEIRELAAKKNAAFKVLVGENGDAGIAEDAE